MGPHHALSTGTNISKAHRAPEAVILDASLSEEQRKAAEWSRKKIAALTPAKEAHHGVEHVLEVKSITQRAKEFWNSPACTKALATVLGLNPADQKLQNDAVRRELYEYLATECALEPPNKGYFGRLITECGRNMENVLSAVRKAFERFELEELGVMFDA